MDEYLKELNKLISESAPVENFVALFVKHFKEEPNKELITQYRTVTKQNQIVEEDYEEADDSYDEYDSYDDSYSY